jgi:hypothetical protein
MPSPFASYIDERFRDMEDKLAELEKAIQAIQAGTPATTEGIAGEEEKIGMSLSEAIYNLRVLRISLIQYDRLARELGLPQSIRDSIKYFEDFNNIMYRTMQLVRITDIAIKAMEAGMGPLGWAMLGISAGGYAASLVVSGMRFMGGK